MPVSANGANDSEILFQRQRNRCHLSSPSRQRLNRLAVRSGWWSFRLVPIWCCGSASRSAMFFPEGNLRIWLCTAPTDMRKSYNGLSALVKHHLGDNPLNGNLYVFINRKANQMKILFFDRNGYSIWGKRLEQGQFVVRTRGEKKLTLSFAQLQCLLDGIEWRDARQYKRFSLTTNPETRV